MLVVGLALGLTSGQARAYDPVTGVAYGDTLSCGEMTQNIKTFGEAQEAQYTKYLNGIVVGINIGVAGKADFFEGADVTSRYLFVKKYCEENPLDYLPQAVIAMVIKITGKAPSQLAVSPSPPSCFPTVSNCKKKIM